jgi:hypothetical protein
VKRWFVMAHDEARRRAIECVRTAPDGYVVTVAPPTRSSSQNARMWALLTEVSEQVTWHGRKLTSTEWKDVFSAALRKQDVVPGLDGSFVVLGQRTSQMTVREMGDLMTLIEAFGAERGVHFRDQEETACSH